MRILSSNLEIMNVMGL